MFTKQNDFEVKDVWYQLEHDNHTTLRFIDGRSYSVPLKLSDEEARTIECAMPDDQTMSLMGFRLPDFFPWIEPSKPVYTNYAKLYV